MEQDQWLLRFNGIDKVFGNNAISLFKKSHVAIIGIGGVGSFVAEALARSSIGEITLMDLDDICVSNTNRQIHTLNTTIGTSKIITMGKRLKEINPEIKLNLIEHFFSEDSAQLIFNKNPDYIVDAFDNTDKKCFLINYCKSKNIPLIVTGAAGGKIDPTKIRVTDINESYNDKLLASIKKKLRTHYNFPRGKKKFKIPCIFSEEKPRYPTQGGSISFTKTCNINGKIDCQSGLGSVVFVTGTFGFAASFKVLTDIYEQSNI
jgi:tRNA A37 threonylcarbamoyladenosine dehydratase